MREAEWDFYICRVDDAPASIMLDLSLREQIQELPETQLYVLQVKMQHPGPHNMGDDDEAEAMTTIEHEVNTEASANGIRPIGRLRNNGIWQMSFMGLPGREDKLREIARANLHATGRQMRVVDKDDPDWSYYLNFLHPDEERLRWMQDRRVVDALEAEGDSLDKPRRIDHWIYFKNDQSRAAFAQEVVKKGFQVIELEEDDRDVALQVHRIDTAQLDAINQVTTELTELAEKHQGHYDGWETQVQ